MPKRPERRPETATSLLTSADPNAWCMELAVLFFVYSMPACWIGLIVRAIAIDWMANHG